MQFIANRKLGVSIAAIAIIADYVSKKAAFGLYNNPIEVIPGLFNLKLAFNTGVSFSLFAGSDIQYMPYILAAINIIAGILFLFWMHSKNHTKLYNLGLGMMLGGAIGNAVDRFLYGAVVDFLDIFYANYHFPTFNIADSAITVGVTLLILDGILQKNIKEEK